MRYIPLQIRSAYSLQDSIISVEALVADAARKGYQQLALTDHNVMYGAVSFYQTCLKHQIKPIIGLTADVLDEDETGSSPLVLLAMNLQGYQNLMKISSALQTKASRGMPSHWLKGYSEGLIAITPGFDGAIEKALASEKSEQATRTVQHYLDIFTKERFYFSLHKNSISLPYEHELKQLASKFNIGLVAGSRVHYLQPDDRVHFQAMVCLSENTVLEENTLEQAMDFHLASANEMGQLFVDEPEALRNTEKIANRCQVELQFHQSLLPHYPVPDGVSATQYLREVCEKGFRYRYPNPTKEHFERLDYELTVIANMQFDSYFLIVWDFMRFARGQGILVGPGRGSAAGSLVSYVLGITNVDPIQYELLFERFLNPERISMPDIDIDFPDTRREEVIQYVAKKYGQAHVAQIVTFGTFGSKSAVRDAGRVYGLSQKELDLLSKQISGVLDRKLVNILEASPPLRQMAEQSPIYKQVFQTALVWEGLPRHTSVHAAGVVMSRRPLTEIIPIQTGNDGVHQTQFPMEQLEELGLLKMDFLALRNLTLLDNVLKEINRFTKRNLRLEDIPLDDEKTYAMISRADTVGIFQLESDGMRNTLRRLQPSCFEDIVAVLALFRPGPMDNIPTFIDRKHGKEQIQYPHPDLEKILKNTYGIIVYQEQILQIASNMAGFTLGEADLLRKAVNKKRKEILDQERSHFVRGAIGKGYSENTANSVYDLIVKFANYGFNRSHSVAYGMIAYQLAYLKANYSRFFTAEMMTSLIGNYDKIAYLIGEQRTQGVKILPPSISESSYGFRACNENSIRFGLAAIKNVSGAVIKAIFHERKIESFKDFFDFVVRMPAKLTSKTVIESLIYAGCFDEFGKERATYIASIGRAIDHAAYVNPDGQGMGMLDEDFFMKPTYASAAPMSSMDQLENERIVLGTYISAHPVSSYQSLAKQIGAIPLSHAKIGELFINIAYIHRIKTIRTKKGEQMAFVQLGDESKTMEAVIFPKVFEQVKHLLKLGNICIIEGKLEQGRNLQIVIQRIYENDEATASLKNAIFINIANGKETIEKLKQLKRLFAKHRGNTKVYLHYEKNNQTICLDRKDWVNPSEPFIQECKKIIGTLNVKVTTVSDTPN